MSYSSSSISEIAPFVKMTQDASKTIKILMKIHKRAALNSPWERPHKVGLTLGPAVRLSLLIRFSSFFSLKPLSFSILILIF